MLGRRGFALESVAVRICREAGGRVRTNMLVRDMDLDVPVTDYRRLEVVVDGLPLRGGAQLAVDTTLVCALHVDGTPRRGSSAEKGSDLLGIGWPPTVESSLSWWQWKWGAGGQARRAHS